MAKLTVEQAMTQWKAFQSAISDIGSLSRNIEVYLDTEDLITGFIEGLAEAVDDPDTFREKAEDGMLSWLAKELG